MQKTDREFKKRDRAGREKCEDWGFLMVGS